MTLRPTEGWPQPGWSRELLQRVADEHTPGEDRLRALSGMVRDAQAHLDAVLEARDTCSQRVRDEGVAMVDIARWAGVDDAYLSRRLLSKGARPRYGRSLPPGPRTPYPD